LPASLWSDLPPDPDPDELLTDDQAAALLTVGKTTVKALRRDGVLPTIRIGGSVRVRAVDVNKIRKEGTG